MKKIAYIELDTHAEIAMNFMDLMKDSKEFSVDYYFSKKIINFLGFQQNNPLPENIKIVTIENLIYQIEKFKYDLVIIGTVHRYFNIFKKICENYNTSIICHNLNFVQAKNPTLLFNIFKKDVAFRLKLLFKEGLLQKSKVYNKANNLLVLDESLESQNLNLKLIFLPLFFTKIFNKTENEDITIVIPGTVSQKRRDYKHIFEKIIKFKNIYNFQFIFLGKAKDKELNALKNLEKKLPENVSIKYFTEKVPQNNFDEYMKKADILWCPIKKNSDFFSVKETYGTTKMTGNIGDAIKYAKFAIFPKFFLSEFPFIISENEANEHQMIEILNQNSYDFQDKFNQQKVLKNLEESLLRSI